MTNSSNCLWQNLSGEESSPYSSKLLATIEQVFAMGRTTHNAGRWFQVRLLNAQCVWRRSAPSAHCTRAPCGLTKRALVLWTDQNGHLFQKRHMKTETVIFGLCDRFPRKHVRWQNVLSTTGGNIDENSSAMKCDEMNFYINTLKPALAFQATGKSMRIWLWPRSWKEPI